MKSIGLVTPFLAAGVAARFNKLNGRDIISIGPGGTCCPAPVTVQLQPAYYSEVFKYPTQVDPFRVGETVTVSACPFTLITTRTLTTTITGTLPPGCPTTSSTVSGSPGSASTSSSASASASSVSSASASSSASISVSVSTSVTTVATTTPPSSSSLVSFFLAYTSLPAAKRGEQVDVHEKRQILPGQTASPVTLVDLISGPAPTANVVLPAGCNNATRFTLSGGVIVVAGTNDALAKRVGAVQAVLGTLIDPTPNEVNTTFSINSGVVGWVASDGTGQANFFACANGVVAGFPSYAVDGCVQVQVRTFGLDECSAAQQSTTTSSRSTSTTTVSSSVVTSSSSTQIDASTSSSSSSSSSGSVSSATTASSSTQPSLSSTTTSSTGTSANTVDPTLGSTQSSSSSSSSASTSGTSASSTSSDGVSSSSADTTSQSVSSSSSSSSVSSSVVPPGSSSVSSSSTSSGSSSTTVSTTPTASPTCVVNLPSVCLTLSGTSGLSLIFPAAQCQAAFLQILNVSQLPASLNCLVLGTLGIGTGNDILTCIANGGILCPATSSSTSSVVTTTSSVSTVTPSPVSTVSSSSSLTTPSSSLTTTSASPSASPLCVVNLPGVCLDLSGETGLQVTLLAIQCQAALENVLNVGALPASLTCLTQAALGLGGQTGDDILVCIANSGILCPAPPPGTSTTTATTTASPAPTCVVNIPGVCLTLSGTTGLGVIGPALNCQNAFLQVLNVGVLPASLNCLAQGVLGLGGSGDDILACIANSGILCAAPPPPSTSTSAVPSAPSCVVNIPGVCLDLTGTTGLGVIGPALNCQNAFLQVLNIGVLPASLNCLAQGVLGLGGSGDAILACIANSGILCAAPPPPSTSTSAVPSAPSCVVNIPGVCLDLTGTTGLGVIGPALNCQNAFLQVLNIGVLPASLNCLAQGVLGLGGSGDAILACIANSGILCAAPPPGTTSGLLPSPTSILNVACIDDLPTDCADLSDLDGLSLLVPVGVCLTQILLTNLDTAAITLATSCLNTLNINLLTQGESIVSCLTTNIVCTGGTVPTPTTTAGPTAATSGIIAPPTSILPVPDCLTTLPTSCSSLTNLTGLTLIALAPQCLLGLQNLPDLSPTRLLAATTCINSLNPLNNPQGAQLIACVSAAVLC